MTERPLAGVGRTALGVAQVRAHETTRPDRLFDDPYASAFVAAMPDAAIDLDHMTDEQRRMGIKFALHAIIRTRFYDDYLIAANLRQVVLLAAGLDTRAFRLAWPGRTHVFEVDLPEVLAFKQKVLDARAAAPRCLRTTVAADLREDWPAALESAGFDPTRPTAWLLEGLLVYLDQESVGRLMTTVDDHSAPASQIAFEYTTPDTTAILASAQTTGGLTDFSSLWRDGATVDTMQWLRDHGWQPTVHGLAALAEGYGRPLRGTAASNLLSAVRGPR